ncbi:hypothetical protein ACFVSN_40420 [Kitasatospora sp. NPDC057904]|uniref:hypothetical protein n=1 Tax=unclassified Kitasatospora TaxID=2633591 RepID=UPI0036DDA6C6
MAASRRQDLDVGYVDLMNRFVEHGGLSTGHSTFGACLCEVCSPATQHHSLEGLAVVNQHPSGTQDIEQIAAATLPSVTTAAHRIADLAVRDDRYDQMAALAAAAYATRATAYLPLPDYFLEDSDGEIAYRDLADRLEAIANDLDDLGRRSTDPREIRDRHTAALHSRDAAIALRNALPIEDGAVG